MGKKSKRTNKDLFDGVFLWLVDHKLFKEGFHHKFEVADLENNKDLFDEIILIPFTSKKFQKNQF